MFKLFSSSKTQHNEEKLWEIESLLRYGDSKLNQALIAQKIFEIEPQKDEGNLEGIIFLIEEKNQELALKIRAKLMKTTKEAHPSKRVNPLEFGILLVLLLQTTILVRQHQNVKLCSTTNIYLEQAGGENQF